MEIQGSVNAVKTLYINRYGVASGSQHRLRAENAYFEIASANSEPIVLTGGNVLIGTTTDDTVNKLQVNGTIKSSSSISMGNSSKQAVRGVPDQDNAAVNLATIMPSIAFGGTFLSLTLQILSTDGGAQNSSIYNCSRDGGTTWSATLVSSSGSANTLTLTFAGTTSAPTLALSGSSYNLFSVVYSVILR
jgi:hypothetical protein